MHRDRSAPMPDTNPAPPSSFWSPPTRRGPFATAVRRYLMAAGLTLALAVPYVLLAERLLQHEPPATFFVIPIILSAYLGGLGPGLLSSAIALVLGWVALVGGHPSLDLDARADVARLAGVAVVGGLISVLCEALLRSRWRAERGERLYATTLAGIPDGVVAVDAEARVTWLNPEATRLTGWPLAYAVGQPFRTVFLLDDEDSQQEIEDPVTKVLRTGVLYDAASDDWSACLRSADGRRRPIDHRTSPVSATDGRVEGAVIIFRDATSRRRTEDAIRERLAIQEQLERVAEAAPGGMYAYRLYPDGRATVPYASAGFLDIAGVSAADVAEDAEAIFSRIPDDDRARVRIGIMESARSMSIWEDEFRAEHPVHGSIWIAGRSAPSREPDGSIVWYGFIVDVTHRHRTEEALARAQKLEALGTLAGGIAHDFNNMLFAILGNAHLASDELPRDHPAQALIKEIDQAGVRAADLVRRILAFSRPQEQGREVVELAPVVAEAVRLLRATLPASVEISTSASAEVPLVMAEVAQVHQAVVNLVTNAAQAIGSAFGTIAIHLDGADLPMPDNGVVAGLVPGRYARITVTDNGCGMDDATQARIFDPFFTTKPQGQGTGLGLSVVHGVMRSHRGRVTVSSRPGEGTSFSLYFPAAVDATEPTSVVEEEKPEPGQGQRILYVDDEPVLVSLAQRALGRLGYDVDGYTDPALALERFFAEPDRFDAVITDLAMPSMSGLDLVREVRSVRPSLPAFLTSGRLTSDDEQTAKDLQVRECIQKPDTLPQVERALAGLFGASSAAPH